MISPVTAIVFDCDGTLSRIEGIDLLAEYNGVGSIVKEMTEQAMNQTGINPKLYQARLELVKPSLEQIEKLGQAYCENVVEDAIAVIDLFKRLNKNLYILSAGLRPAIVEFAKLLGISEQHVYAVDAKFDSEGHFLSYDKSSPLLFQSGKRDFLAGLPEQKIVFAGDGLNDCMAREVVFRFVGFGGVFYRENVEALSDLYIRSRSMAPLIRVVLTNEEIDALTSEEKVLSEKL